MLRSSLISLLFSTFAFAQETPGSAGAGVTSFDSSEFNSYVEQAIEEWDVPGLAIVVVKGDSVVFEKGYGLRELSGQKPVNAETIFAAASTTKAFTAAAVGILVDEGKLNWDDPVVEHLPSFKLRDPYLTRLITVRDLLTHRAGLPNTDFLWIDPETSTEEIVQRLEHVETVYPLRSGFIYQNIMYAVAGELIEEVSGSSWEDFLRTRILEPLKMQRTFTSRAGSRDAGNVARPHDYAGEELIVIEDSYADAIGPAGSMWSSVADMSRWLRFLLRGCETETGENLLEKSTCEELFKPQVVLPSPMYPTAQITEPNWNTYGLGWFQHDYEGRKVDFHTGSLSGMVAIAGMIRDEELGIYVLGNRDHAEVRHALMYRVFDLFDNDPARDWSSEIKDLYDGLQEKQQEARSKADSVQIAERVPNTGPGFSREAYTGTYTHPLYGKVRITVSGEELQFAYGVNRGKLVHWHHNTFRLESDRPQDQSRPLVTFTADASGKPRKVVFGNWEFEKEGFNGQ